MVVVVVNVLLVIVETNNDVVMVVRNVAVVVVVVVASRISVSVSFLSQSFDSNPFQTNHIHPWKYGNVCWKSRISFVRLLGMDLFFSRRVHVVPVCS